MAKKQPKTLRNFRIIRGALNPDGSQKWGMGSNWKGFTPAEALAREADDVRRNLGDPGPLGVFLAIPNKPAPVIKVYELVEVPVSEWT